MAANIHTHNFRQCSHASVGLAQAHPNYAVHCFGVVYHIVAVEATLIPQFHIFGVGRIQFPLSI